MKIGVNGCSCDSIFCINYEVEPNDKIESLTIKIEQTIPCTKVTSIWYNNTELDQYNSFVNYNISDGDILNVETNTNNYQVQKVACMGCSYHNIIYFSANVARSPETITYVSSETIKNSIRRYMKMLDTNDQTKIKQFLNYVTEEYKIRFMVCTRDMLKEYVKTYRNTEYANMVEFDYIELLNELRCPVCFSKFSLYSKSSHNPVQLCTLSDKHYVCEQCFSKVSCCPVCKGNVREKAISSNYIINLQQTSVEKLEKYCFPTTLNSIKIKDNEKPFAHGAFCNIFKVKNYAIKCPRVPASPGSDIERGIMHEIFLSRPLSHIPNILNVYGGIRLQNYGVSIVMEYVDGPSLATALDDGSILNLTFQKRLDIALGICKGLGELHLAEIIHRDFKPANVLLARSSGDRGFLPKIADFGVSFLIQTASATAVKNSGGTVGYDAPEVAQGATPSFQSDIYALSFTLYELLTLHRPFSGFRDAQILTKFTLKGERPRDWSVITSDQKTLVVPDVLKQAIDKGWAMECEDRSRIGEIIWAIRKSINSKYKSCTKRMVSKSEFITESHSSYNFMDTFDNFELLAIKEIIKRCIIEDSEAITLLLDNDAWG